MSVGFTSTTSIYRAMQFTTQRLQTELVAKQRELSSGKKADMGLELGALSSQTVSLRRQLDQIDQIATNNKFVASRMQAAQAAMQSLVDGAQQVIKVVTAETGANLDRTLVAQAGRDALTQLTGALNTSFNGEYIFSGINTDVVPIDDYFTTPPSAAKAAVEAAFLAEFGIAMSDPGAANISAAQVKSFIDGPFLDLFSTANWQANWSNASDQAMRGRVTLTEVAETSVSANEAAFANLAAAYTLLGDVADTALAGDGLDQLVASALELLGSGIERTGQVQGRLGLAEERVAQGSERLDLQRVVLSGQLSSLEEVDPYEVASRLSEIMTELEASYTLTSRINRMSLLDFI